MFDSLSNLSLFEQAKDSIYLSISCFQVYEDSLNRLEKKPVAICSAKNKVNPSPAKSIYLNFQPLEVVSRYRDPQPQVVENHSYLFNLRPDNYKYWCLNTHFIPNNSHLISY